MSSPSVLHIAGYTTCGFYRRAVSVVSSLSILFPTRVKIVEHPFEDRSAYREWLVENDGFRHRFTDSRAAQHSSSPFVWFSKEATQEPKADDIDGFLGGHDDTLDWCRDFLSPAEGINDRKGSQPKMMDDGHTADHGYDYDLVVIGGGSGGMAASKEAADLGAKVACLDFVKPSPQGTTWGLGGTCVNVGCIPKKLFHISSMLRESIKEDSTAFGMKLEGINDGEEPNAPHSWEELRENVINYIRSLNFKYRVRLREKNVTYLNKLGKFVDKHTLEVTDKKGKVSTITSSRFLVAVGGRPTPLPCEGADLAISSDDIFSLENNPGKTLCVGASYISLECAGFLAGLGIDTTVAVRSILLRGFDRECADKIDAYMVKHGVKFKREVTPRKLEKLESGKIKVSFSDGTEEEFDTVLGAIGRTADTEKLGLENVGVETSPKNRKIIGKMEQSTCPNVYAVGDVLEGCPELTPVAIQAGVKLARRLFGGSTEPMDYINVCTTVFTPIEYSCVGYSEEDAIEKFGAENIDVYHKEFLPLEWSISHGRSDDFCFTKAIVEKGAPNKVLGLHYIGPQAGEVMQGYGSAMKCGLTWEKLKETVGIHPTSSEEIVTLSVTKSSGESAAASGC